MRNIVLQGRELTKFSIDVNERKVKPKIVKSYIYILGKQLLEFIFELDFHLLCVTSPDSDVQA